MSTITETKRLRILDWDKDAQEYSKPINGFRSVLMKGKMVRRSEPLPAKPRQKAGDCSGCGLPVMVSEGQIVRVTVGLKGQKLHTHKACRKA